MKAASSSSSSHAVTKLCLYRTDPSHHVIPGDAYPVRFFIQHILVRSGADDEVVIDRAASQTCKSRPVSYHFECRL